MHILAVGWSYATYHLSPKEEKLNSLPRCLAPPPLSAVLLPCSWVWGTAGRWIYCFTRATCPPTLVHCPKRIKKVSIKPVLVFNLSGAVSQFWLGSKKLKQQVQGKGKKMKVHDFLKLAWTSKIQAINLEHINLKKTPLGYETRGNKNNTKQIPNFPVSCKYCSLPLESFHNQLLIVVGEGEPFWTTYWGDGVSSWPTEHVLPVTLV